ncbi:Transcriptional regulator, MarR family [hydrothermal vent metagenome]|uniref:Transcriptional regulator, MarR family n=1 Tax=hydrothermal vent metagenome TaxID=652676 RepID=A0A3B0S2B1_9ZZZZ
MADGKNDKLVLERFLPYRLSYLTNIISRKLARLYSEQFDITPHEWKVLANLSRRPNISAAETGVKTAMDKVAVSRAIRGLCDKGLVHKIFAKEDRRRSVLNLTKKGREIYHQIEPQMIEYENYLQDILNQEEQNQLDCLLTKLTIHVDK